MVFSGGTRGARQAHPVRTKAAQGTARSWAEAGSQQHAQGNVKAKGSQHHQPLSFQYGLLRCEAKKRCAIRGLLETMQPFPPPHWPASRWLLPAFITWRLLNGLWQTSALVLRPLPRGHIMKSYCRNRHLCRLCQLRGRDRAGWGGAPTWARDPQRELATLLSETVPQPAQPHRGRGQHQAPNRILTGN